jgi:hypothetical protein
MTRFVIFTIHYPFSVLAAICIVIGAVLIWQARK